MTVLKAFACRPKWSNHEEVIYHKTAGKAKAVLMRQLDCYTDLKYTDLRARKIPDPPESKDFRRTANYRDVPFAYIGQKVILGQKRKGIIVGCNSSANFNVLITEGRGKDLILNCHPNWALVYLDHDEKPFFQTIGGYGKEYD